MCSSGVIVTGDVGLFRCRISMSWPCKMNGLSSFIDNSHSNERGTKIEKEGGWTGKSESMHCTNLACQYLAT